MPVPFGLHCSTWNNLRENFYRLIWHEGYHHGQIKIALKLAGQPFDYEEIGPLTWGVGK